MYKHDIYWHGRKFSALDITLLENTEREEMVTVSTLNLAQQLIDDRNLYPDEATMLDESIFFYLDAEEMQLPEEQIRQILENAIS